MIRKIPRNESRVHIHRRIRQKVQGTSERPRLCIYRSLNHIYAQMIDDIEGRTLVAASSLGKGSRVSGGNNVAAAKEVGQLLAERAKDKGISRAVFDRGGYLYHGRVKALAEAARAAGLEF